MTDLTGKVALVTGASKGIGAGIARGLAAAGAAVAVNYAGDRDGAKATVDAIEAAGGRAVAIAGDVSKGADVRRIFETVQKTFGGFDVLVNNAGVFTFGPLEDVTEDEFHRQFNTNVLAPMLTSREALKYFPASGGSIVNVSSVVSENPQAQSAVRVH
jgi:3-oxoacyl-[acyl-carrier protein] reductase